MLIDTDIGNSAIALLDAEAQAREEAAEAREAAADRWATQATVEDISEHADEADWNELAAVVLDTLTALPITHPTRVRAAFALHSIALKAVRTLDVRDIVEQRR